MELCFGVSYFILHIRSHALNLIIHDPSLSLSWFLPREILLRRLLSALPLLGFCQTPNIANADSSGYHRFGSDRLPPATCGPVVDFAFRPRSSVYCLRKHRTLPKHYTGLATLIALAGVNHYQTADELRGEHTTECFSCYLHAIATHRVLHGRKSRTRSDLASFFTVFRHCSHSPKKSNLGKNCIALIPLVTPNASVISL